MKLTKKQKNYLKNQKKLVDDLSREYWDKMHVIHDEVVKELISNVIEEVIAKDQIPLDQHDLWEFLLHSSDSVSQFLRSVDKINNLKYEDKFWLHSVK